MNIVATNTAGAIAAYVAGRRSFNDELSAGVMGGFAVITYKGKEWNVKFQGVKTLITRNDVHGDGSNDPAASLEVVLVKSSPVITKTFYLKGWEDGSNNAPDCFSSNGITPDANAPHKQNNICKTCKWDAFGSRAQEGFKGKACQDNRRVAIVPSKDIDNDAFGGPMLLRVPPASLKELVKHATALDQKGLPYFGVVSKISFTSDSYPHLIFGPVRVLSDDEFNRVLALRDDARVGRILSEAVTPDAVAGTAAQQAPAADDPYANLGPAPGAAATTVTPEVKAETTAAPKPEPKPEPKPAPEPEEDDEEAAALKALEAARAAKKAKAEATAKAASKTIAKADKKDEAPKSTVAAPAAFDAHLDQMLNDLP